VSLRQLPNAISVVRLLLVPPLVVLILAHRTAPALAVFLIAGFSDALDGFLAKRFGWQTVLGGFLDGAADKALLVGSMLALAWIGGLPVWLVAAAVARDLIIVTGAAAFHWLVGRFTAEPSRLSKLNTLLQLLVVMIALAPPWAAALIGPGGVRLLHAATLLTIAASGAHYIVVWGRRAAAGLDKR